ncbi:MAG: sugar phosphate isomerase/epimerase [Planctomycetota bacterium]
MTLPIGLQLYTVRDLLTGDQLGDTCKKLAEVGYTHAEVGPFSGHSTEAVTKAARDAGMTVVGSHEGSLIGDDANDTLKMLGDLGIRHAIQPYLPDEHRTADGYRKVAKTLEKVANFDGLSVLYHNHDWEFDTVDGDHTGYDLLIMDTGLGAELDTCWVSVAGRNPTQLMKRLSGRLPLIHVKDCSDFEKKTLCELGDGKVPVKEIVATASQCGVECLVVEQDNSWMNDDPMASAKKSFDYLKSVL